MFQNQAGLCRQMTSDPFTPVPPNSDRIAFIGFGEASGAIVKGLAANGALRFAAFDRKTEVSETAVAKRAEYNAAGVAGCESLAELLAGPRTVFSLVTADQAHAAAQAAATVLRPGTYFFDGNSCAPNTKVASAAVIESAGGHYVDTAIMAPVYPKMHRVPILLSGPHADAARDILTGFGMDAKIEAGPVGRASSIKMIRSIMVKGLEALTAECVLAARLVGVEDVVLNSLGASGQGGIGRGQAAYNLERMMQHGIRRAAEMREVAVTVNDLGLPGSMAAATVNWHQVIGEMGLDAGPDELDHRADAILAALGLIAAP